MSPTVNALVANGLFAIADTDPLLFRIVVINCTAKIQSVDDGKVTFRTWAHSLVIFTRFTADQNLNVNHSTASPLLCTAFIPLRDCTSVNTTSVWCGLDNLQEAGGLTRLLNIMTNRPIESSTYSLFS